MNPPFFSSRCFCLFTAKANNIPQILYRPKTGVEKPLKREEKSFSLAERSRKDGSRESLKWSLRIMANPYPAFKKLILMVAVCSGIAGCNAPPRQDDGVANSNIRNPECYLFVQNRDTIKLALESVEGKIKGKLAFRFFEKDASHGVLNGEMHGDTLLATYAFTSEGLMSYREVAFLRREDSFVMGTGEILNRDNRDVFRSPELIEYDSEVILRHVDCAHAFLDY